MAEFTFPGSSFHPIMPSVASSGSSSSAFDESLDDVCSICLEHFCFDDPAIATTCKHEYHLQCILEWSHRSKECPICWQFLTLMDPACQKLTTTTEVEQSSNERMNILSYSLHDNSHDNNADHELSYGDNNGFNDHIYQQESSALSGARYVGMIQRWRNMELGLSHDQPFQQRQPLSYMRRSMSSAEDQFHSAVSSPRHHSPVLHRSGHVISGMNPSHSVPSDNQGLKASDLLAFSKSLKSRISTASARYKGSISRGKERIIRKRVLLRNNTVKELSKGVRKEVSAGISGLAKMIDRLDLKSKRSSNSGNSSGHHERKSSVLAKGKQVQRSSSDSAIKDNMGIVQNLNMEKSSAAACSMSSPRG